MTNKTLHKKGDVLIININPKISGKVLFTDYSDKLSGIDGSGVIIKKMFRIASGGIFWNDWTDLTPSNLSKRGYIALGSFTIQVMYEWIGSGSGEVKFESIEFFGKVNESDFNAPTLMASIFAPFLGSEELKLNEENIFKKLYFRGIVPKYIERAEDLDKIKDKDYIDFFWSVSRFFALLITFFKRFENFSNDFDIMREHVRQSGLYFDESDVNLDDLKFLSSHLLDEIRKRGTNLIFKRKGEEIGHGKTAEIDGELIRLLRNKEGDELLYENVPLHKIGWCLGQSSPLYRGTAGSLRLNKTREDTADFQDLNNFSHFSNGGSSVYISDEDSKKCVRINSNSSSSSGLGYDGKADKAYPMDPGMDYEITFLFKVINSGGKITFSVNGFDTLRNELTDAFVTTDYNVSDGLFMEENISDFKKGEWYSVRGIIHSYSTSSHDSKLNIGRGNNLIFNNSFLKYVLPNISLSGSGSIAIHDYKIRPLVRGKNIVDLKNGEINSHSLGFIQSGKLFYSYVRNNNNSQSVNEITDIINKFLLPYNVNSLFTFLEN